MTVENVSIIDAIGTDTATGEARLSIFAHLPWDTDHLRLLQEKINRYLGFVESGEIYSSYPNAKGRPLVIDVFTKFRPTPEATQFFGQASSVAQQYGIALRQQHSGADYADDSA